MKLLLMVSLYVRSISCVLSPNNSEIDNTTLIIGDPPPAQSNHRLISAVLDPLGNSSQWFSPGNITDTTPFLPSGVVQARRSAPSSYDRTSTVAATKDFTPSYFMGEVIQEPYVPERFQTPRSMSRGSSDSVAHPQGLVSAQTISFPKLLPRDDQKKQKPPSYGGPGPEDQRNSEQPLGPYFRDHAPPVHESSADVEYTTTPRYSPQDSSTPYKFEHAHSYHDMHSTKPITFEDDHSNRQKPLSQSFEEHQGYFNPYKYEDNFKEPFTSQPGYNYKHHSGLNDEGRNNYNGVGNIFTGPNDPTKHPYLQYEEYMKSRPELDLVIPSPFYPHESEQPPSHHKGVQYKVYQHKPKSALQGLLHFAAALLPLGLFVAALQPNVLFVNSSQPMPSKGRSLDSLQRPELEVLEQLERGDCERRAFCELAVLGARPDSSAAQRGLWILANRVAEDRSTSSTLRRALTAVKTKSCSVLKCDGPPPT